MLGDATNLATLLAARRSRMTLRMMSDAAPRVLRIQAFKRLS